MSLLAILATIFTIAVIVYAILERLLPHDPDLTAPWTPAEPFPPAARRRPCLDASCRVDHEAIWSNRKVW